MMNDTSFYFLGDKDNVFPVIDCYKKKRTPLEYLSQNTAEIDSILLKFGGVLLRNFNITSVTEFSNIAHFLCPTLMEYIYRSTPRTELGNRIYTATEYPREHHIPLHNEFSYFRTWPSKIIFFCVIPPEEGGETPIADSRKVLQRLNSSLVNEFQEKNVMYLRNYTKGIDLSWEEVFQTEDRAQVEKFCRVNSIQYEWRSDGPELTTKQISQATSEHPFTKEKVWFNQAHLFHISSLPPEIGKTLISELGKEYLPRNACFGDGEEIDIEYLNEVKEAYNKGTIIFKWNKGDIMILDNMLMAHGRRPYAGDRKIVVALG